MDLVITPKARREINAPDASRLAGITYRQLDYWATRGWVLPSVEAGRGRPGRRLYSADDVVRLAALGHFGRSGADVGQLGPQLAALKLPGADVDYLVALGTELALEVIAADGLRAHVSGVGSHVVFDPAPLRRQLGVMPGASARSASIRATEARTA